MCATQRRNIAPTVDGRDGRRTFDSSQTTFGEAPLNNKLLIFKGRAAPGRLAAAGRGIAGHGRLNAFFAISVNSPSMSMVNFCCCVRFAPNATREVAAQPMRSAVRMEARFHAGV